MPETVIRLATARSKPEETAMQSHMMLFRYAMIPDQKRFRETRRVLQVQPSTGTHAMPPVVITSKRR